LQEGGGGWECGWERWANVQMIMESLTVSVFSVQAPGTELKQREKERERENKKDVKRERERERERG